MKAFPLKTMAVSAAACLAATLSISAQTIIYNNYTGDTGYSLDFQNGYSIGNEISLGSAASVSSFSFVLYSANNTFSGPISVTLGLYDNTGDPTPNGYGYYNTPNTGSYLFQDSFDLSSVSGWTALSGGGYGLAVTEDLTSSPVSVPNDFTLAVGIASGLTGGDTVGLEVYSPITVGGVYSGYWFDDGTGWQIKSQSAGNDFGAIIYAVPEPSSFSLGLVGGSILLGLVWLRRQRQVGC